MFRRLPLLRYCVTLQCLPIRPRHVEARGNSLQAHSVHSVRQCRSLPALHCHDYHQSVSLQLMRWALVQCYVFGECNSSPWCTAMYLRFVGCSNSRCSVLFPCRIVGLYSNNNNNSNSINSHPQVCHDNASQSVRPHLQEAMDCLYVALLLALLLWDAITYSTQCLG